MQHQPFHGEQQSGDEIKTLWVGDLQYWMDENYLQTCFSSNGEVGRQNPSLIIKKNQERMHTHYIFTAALFVHAQRRFHPSETMLPGFIKTLLQRLQNRVCLENPESSILAVLPSCKDSPTFHRFALVEVLHHLTSFLFICFIKPVLDMVLSLNQ